MISSISTWTDANMNWANPKLESTYVTAIGNAFRERANVSSPSVLSSPAAYYLYKKLLINNEVSLKNHSGASYWYSDVMNDLMNSILGLLRGHTTIWSSYTFDYSPWVDPTQTITSGMYDIQLLTESRAFELAEIDSLVYLPRYTNARNSDVTTMLTQMYKILNLMRWRKHVPNFAGHYLSYWDTVPSWTATYNKTCNEFGYLGQDDGLGGINFEARKGTLTFLPDNLTTLTSSGSGTNTIWYPSVLSQYNTQFSLQYVARTFGASGGAGFLGPYPYRAYQVWTDATERFYATNGGTYSSPSTGPLITNISLDVPIFDAIGSMRWRVGSSNPGSLLHYGTEDIGGALWKISTISTYYSDAFWIQKFDGPNGFQFRDW